MEEYRDIPDYDGLYQVSNLGNVKSLKNNKERILKPSKNRYLKVVLSKNDKNKTYTIHQLVAITFLNHKPDGTLKIIVDHKDNNNLNNRLDNLQLISQRENSSKDRKGGSSKYTGVYWDKRDSKWVSQLLINNKHKNLGYFDNEIEAADAYQIALKKLNNNNN